MALHFRPTRLVAVDTARLIRVVVEETPRGWTWSVTRGTAIVAAGGHIVARPLSKAQAIDEATRAAEGGQPS